MGYVGAMSLGTRTSGGMMTRNETKDMHERAISSNANRKEKRHVRMMSHG